MWIEYYIKKFVNFLLDFKWMHFILTSYPAINCYFDVSKVQQQTWGKVRESKVKKTKVKKSKRKKASI